MPGGDRTGPMGAGPRTGRAAGFCGGFGVPGYANAMPGRGWGMGGRGGGRGFGGGGWRHGYFATGLPGWMRRGAYLAPYPFPDPQLEKQALKNQADALQAQLDSIKRRLGELETPSTTD
ncbi:DUF5320 domain-containing protein [bacterium]|nr:DUF5320 domain-containing protein [bacterium]